MTSCLYIHNRFCKIMPQFLPFIKYIIIELTLSSFELLQLKRLFRKYIHEYPSGRKFYSVPKYLKKESAFEEFD